MDYEQSKPDKMIKNKIFLVILPALFFSFCSRQKNIPDKTGFAITVITCKADNIQSYREILLSGNVEGNKTVRLGFLVGGRIDFIAGNEGAMVSKGQIISSLDPTSYAIAKELADIQVNQVQDEYNRLKLMYDNKSLSESDFNKISAGLQQAKAQQKLQTKNLADTKLYSPINGVLIKKLAEVGEITGVGIPVLVVSDIRKVKISSYIPENELHNIKLGQSANVSITSLDTVYKGKIAEVGSAADAASRAFSVKIEVENPDLLIRPGMIAEIRILSGEQQELLAVPAMAVLQDINEQYYVYVVDTLKLIAFRRNVKTGKLINDQIVITSGIQKNETIVTGGQHKLVDGSFVELNK